MNCPKCNIELRISEKEGVEIDYCPGCRGVWLDRGELEKIIERSNSNNGYDDYDNYDRRERRPDHDDDDHDDRRQGGYGRGRKKSFLENLFD